MGAAYMSENEIENEVPQEVAPQEQETDVVESTQERQTEKPDYNQINWERANEIMKFQKMQIDELQQKLHQPTVNKVEEEVDEFESLPQDDYLTVEQARKMAAKMAEKTARRAVQESLQEYDSKKRVADDETRCQSKYDDYNYVMENFALPLIKNDPALAYKIQQSKNPAETAYKLGKLSDSYEETMTKAQSSQKAEKIIKNSQRPVSSNASGSLKSQADQFSKMSKEQIWAESQKYARQA